VLPPVDRVGVGAVGRSATPSSSVYQFDLYIDSCGRAEESTGFGGTGWIGDRKLHSGTNVGILKFV
jgi:hypothetical protein